MLKNVTISKIYRSTTRKDGTPYVTRMGKPFQMVNIECSDGLRASMCDFDNKTLNLVEGQVAYLKIEKKGEYTNFSIPSKLDLLEARVEKLEGMLAPKSVMVATHNAQIPAMQPVNEPPIEAYADDLPF